MPVSLRSMRYFVTAIAHGNISRAAADLNVAASAVAAAIDQIEARFQLKLVNRHRARGIEPTASGKVFTQKFKHLLEEYDALLFEGTELKQSLKGDLRIGYYAPVAPAFLPEILSGLAGQDGQTTYHLEECDNDRAQAGLLAGDFDAILFVSDVARPQVEFDVLIEAPAYCLAPADHPIARQASVRLRHLAGEPLIVLNRPVAADYYRMLFDEAGHSPAALAYANSTEMVRSLVGAGHGCAVLNMLPGTDISYAGHRLAAVPITDPLPRLSLSVGYGKSNQRRLVSQFARLCRDYFRDGPGYRHVVAG
ncbi:LysR family transcriptional regulator (plasmid) [Leisingera sp. M527]|uniref:LysR family transcriptional regulator n=1 Tax=Leisingera sp. M527 TaxID=2867014 RepID=UPI0021A45396|nr:LysR family transcriptional regulator [Leisingera sp. M527]UWQ35753.1 LysR family transcriptional regulator [Leisingera sp. M527]